MSKGINWLALFAIGIATVTIANDFSAINVALPTMEGDFHTNINTIQWVVNAYALTFGVMIVTGGRLADMFGRRNAFFLGAAIFAVMSAAGGAAPNEAILIVTRSLMGIGAALMLPAAHCGQTPDAGYVPARHPIRQVSTRSVTNVRSAERAPPAKTTDAPS